MVVQLTAAFILKGLQTASSHISDTWSSQRWSTLYQQTSSWLVLRLGHLWILKMKGIALSYHQTCNIRCFKYQNLKVSHFVLQLSLPNPLKVLSQEWRCSQIPKLKCFSFCLAVVFAQSIEGVKVLSQEWRCSQCCSNYIWVINIFIAN